MGPRHVSWPLPPPLNKPLAAGQITDHWALTIFYPQHSPIRLLFLSRLLLTHTHLSPLRPMSWPLIWLNWIWLFPYLSLSFCLSLVVCSAGLARAAAVKDCISQLYKQTAEDLGQPQILYVCWPVLQSLLCCGGIMRAKYLSCKLEFNSQKGFINVKISICIYSAHAWNW